MSEVIISELKISTLPPEILFQLLILYSVIIYLVNMWDFESVYTSKLNRRTCTQRIDSSKN